MIKQANSEVKLLLSAAGLMWLLQVVNMFFAYKLSHFGIVPREIAHLPGIIFAPFLHWGLGHIIANTIPFVILGYLVHQTRHLVTVTLTVWFLGGALVWLFAREAAHAGASGVIMGYFGFLLSHAWFTRSIRSIIIGILTVIFYGGMIFGLLDFRSHISFEGHLFGFISGVFCAWLISKKSQTAH